MKLAFEAAGDWQAKGRRWTWGELNVDTDDVPLHVPRSASHSALVTHDGWSLSLTEFVVAGTVHFLATLELAGETAAIRAHCPLEQRDESRSRFHELLRTSRPSWPEAILLSELLALPNTDT